jgi:cysteine-rich repeat protein
MRTRLFLVMLLVVGCGGDTGVGDMPDATVTPVPDADLTPDAEIGICGNIFLEGTEECDDGNLEADDGCSPTCELECGDGRVGGDELCDPGITEGQAGACPTDANCTDDDACTSGVVSGSGCQVTCEQAPITQAMDDDLCCPDGENANTDNDCTAQCGNGVLEGTESCDTTIPSGNVGACPTACDDGEDCTANELFMPGTCAAECRFTAITDAVDDDDCCPDGATVDTDNDCLPDCGNGELDLGETCDTSIATGTAGSCPSACDDGDVCTSDALVNAGTCRADCLETPVLAGGPSDSCCPVGADLGDDVDCASSCGDGVISSPETCDDGNEVGGDGCSATCAIEPIGFRFSDMDLRDPHVFASVSFLGCTDVTDLSLFGNNGVNPTLQLNIQNDRDDPADGILDLSLVQTFDPLRQAAGTSTEADLVFPDCTDPIETTTCELPADADHTLATANNLGSRAVCLAPLAGTLTGAYSPEVVSPTAPNGGGVCYNANAGTVTFSLGGIPITLIDAQIAGEWFGSPATEIRDGLIRGFLSETTANETIIPEGTTGIGSIDGSALSALLPGGVGNCEIDSADGNGDKDSYTPPGGTAISGWYFYLNFTAVRVSYTEL